MFVFMFSVIVLLLFDTVNSFFTQVTEVKWQVNDTCTHFVIYFSRSSHIYTTLYLNIDYQCFYFMQFFVVVSCNFVL